MAKRRNRTKAQPESKRGIVVTLVFFILATIGLGVATYYGFADKDKLVKAKKDADAALKAMEDQRDIYRFETHFVRSYLGVPLEAEQRTALAVAKSDFEANQLGPKDAERDKRLVKVKAVVDKLNGTIPWDPSSSQPMNQGKVQDLFQIIQEKQAEIDRLKAEQKALVDARDTAQKNEKLARDNHEAAKTEYETKYQALVKEKNENLAKYLKKVADTEDSFKKFNNEKFDKAIELAQQLIDLRKEKGGVEKLYRDL